MRSLFAAGAALGLLAVGLGAFGAHALAPRLGERGSSLWTLASQYALVHAVALLAVAQVTPWCRGAVGAGIALCLGVVLFSGSLYGLALGGPRWLGPVTPVGGALLLGGWARLLWGAWQRTLGS